MIADNKYKQFAESYFEGILSVADQREFEAWLHADSANEAQFRQWELEWASSARCADATDAAWQRFKQIKQQKTATKMTKVIPFFGHKRLIYWAVAACVLLLVMVPIVLKLYQSQTPTDLVAESQTPTSETFYLQASAPTTYYLPDSTMVRLNSGSELAYTSDYGMSKRSVVLTGEGYFEVTKNKDCPFTVLAEEIVVEVTGTHFNVSAYPTDLNVRVTLLEGSVLVHYADTMYKLQPSEELTYSKANRKLVQQECNEQKAILWQQNQLNYSNICLGDLLNRLSRYYNYPIVYDSSTKMQSDVRFVLKEKRPMEEVLDALGEVYQLQIAYRNDSCFVIPN